MRGKTRNECNILVGSLRGNKPLWRLWRKRADNIKLQLTSWSRLLLEELIATQLVKKYAASFGT
jgi:hypothetical protein